MITLQFKLTKPENIRLLCDSIYFFQFNGMDLFYWIDQAGNNRTVKELINGNSHVCDDKAPIIREDSLKITNKDYLPLKAQYIY